jgi:hypothetical protein
VHEKGNKGRKRNRNGKEMKKNYERKTKRKINIEEEGRKTNNLILPVTKVGQQITCFGLSSV